MYETLKGRLTEGGTFPRMLTATPAIRLHLLAGSLLSAVMACRDETPVVATVPDEATAKVHEEDCWSSEQTEAIIEAHEVEVEVLKKGAKPYRLLRYDFIQDQQTTTRETSTAHVEIKFTQGTQPAKVTAQITRTSKITDISEDGVASVEQHIESRETQHPGGNISEESTRSQFSITPCGLAFAWESEEEDFDPEMLPILPDAALGRGAQWVVRYRREASKDVPTGGMVQSIFTLVTPSDAGHWISYEHTLVLNGGVLPDSEGQAQLIKGMGTGQTEGKMDPTHPFVAEVDGTAELVMQIRTPQGDIETTQAVTFSSKVIED
jgi:hypothetical protein